MRKKNKEKTIGGNFHRPLNPTGVRFHLERLILGRRGGKEQDSSHSVVANNSFWTEATWADLMASLGS